MMEKEILVSVNKVSKKFCKDLKTSLKYGLYDSVGALMPYRKESAKTLRDKEFWAVKDISFELRRGECIGLIGHNGAGKSTLLKVINGLIMPDEGSVTLKGKVGALIELGAGFNPILTGRENIYNNAAILGFAKKEIDAKLNDIISFSEIEEFIDTPVQNYSSGMKVRLGFAIAAHLEPDVLIIDEVLAVGDLGFVLKCFKTIDQLLPNTAVIFVSHSMPMVSRICNHIILMDHGVAKYNGPDVSKGIDLYYNKFSNNGKNVVFTDNSLVFESVTINGFDSQAIIAWQDDINILLNIQNLHLTEVPEISLSIFDKEQRGVAIFQTNLAKKPLQEGTFQVEISHQNIQLSKGVYTLNLIVSKAKNVEPILRVNTIASFQIKHEDEVWPPFLLAAKSNIKTV